MTIERTFALVGADYTLKDAYAWIVAQSPLNDDYDFYQIGDDALNNDWPYAQPDFNGYKVRFINEDNPHYGDPTKGHKILCTGNQGQIEVRPNNTLVEHSISLIGLYLQATASSSIYLIEIGGWNVANDVTRIELKDLLVKGHTNRNNGIKFHGTKTYLEAFNIKAWNMKNAFYCSIGGTTTPTPDRRYIENVVVLKSDTSSFFCDTNNGNEFQFKNVLAIDPIGGNLFQNIGDGVTGTVKIFNSASSPGTNQVQGTNVKQNIVTLDNIITTDDTDSNFLKLIKSLTPGISGSPDLGQSGIIPTIINNVTDISGNTRPGILGFYSIGAEEQQYIPIPTPPDLPEEMPDQSDLVDLKLTKDTHDIYLNAGDLAIVAGKDELIQKVKIKLLFFFAEWFLDTSYGVKYYDVVLKKNPDLNEVDSLLKATILESPEIIELVNYKSDFDLAKRTLSVTFKANSIYGEITFNEEIL